MDLISYGRNAPSCAEQSGIDALVQPFLTRDSAQPGKMRVLTNLLNPGAHYPPVPQANHLVVVALRLRLTAR
jgi:hypothetical protein